MNRKKPLKRILLIKTGGTIKKIRLRYEDFEDWFAKYMGVPGFLQVDVFKQQPLPVAENLAGIIITGSAAMVSDREDWSERTAAWLEKAIHKDIPTLGVCYGHQLLAHALGGRVGPNPLGRQMGTVRTQLVNSGSEDPLLGHLPQVFAAQSSHQEVVLELPPGATNLAISPLDNNFAVRFAENAWGVQFHPEFSAPVMLEYIRCRADALREEGLDPVYLFGEVTDTPEATSVLQKFKELLPT
jgi:GMP synthase (glutamine-hydrolysing)